MSILFFVVAAVAVGILQGVLFPPGPWGFGGKDYWMAYILNWDLNLLLTLVLFFLTVHRQPKTAPAGSTLRTVVRVLAGASTIVLGAAMLLFLDSKVVGGLITLLWVLLWFYLYALLEQLRRLIKTFERDELFKILSLFLTLTFNSFAFFIAFGLRGGSITGYWLVLGVEFVFAFIIIGVAALLFGQDVPQGGGGAG